MDEYGNDIITVIDDDGKEHEFEELDRIETDDNRRYVAVVPVYDSGKEMLDNSCELIILKVSEDNGESYLEAINDDAEFDEISEIFEQRLAGEYDFESDDDENTESNS